MAKPITIGAAGGEYMESVVVMEWMAKIGDTVREGDSIVTVETAKAATEIGAPCDGVLSAILAEPGTEVALSEILGLIGTSVEDTTAETEAPSEDETSGANVVTAAKSVATEAPSAKSATHGRLVASPAARREAERTGINLSAVIATSPTGRIKLRDVGSLGNAVVETDLPADQSGPLRSKRSGVDRGTPIVLLHGFGADAMSWYPLERVLSQSRPVIGIDLPNHGQSPKRRTRDFECLARDVIEAFDALSIDSAHIVGHSLGGACALAIAQQRPGKVASMSLIAPGGLGPKFNGDFVTGLAQASTPAALERWLKAMVGNERVVNKDFVGAAMASRADPALRAAQLQMARDLFPRGVPAFDLQSALSGLTCPTRIIWGKADAIIPWEQALRVPGFVGLHLFDGVGHVPQIEIPEQVLEILDSVFNSTARG